MMKIIKGLTGKAPWLLASLLFLAGAGCGSAQLSQESTENTMKAELMAETEEGFTVGLLLNSRDAQENEEIVADMEAMAEENGIRLIVYTPDVSAEEAKEAGALPAGSFASCDVNPVEYQMWGINEFVAEGAEVIALHANHSDALESVLTAARAVGIRICAWDQEVSEGSCDVYVESLEDVPEAVLELLETGN